MRWIKASELRSGDLIDLEGDPIADGNNHGVFAAEYAQVARGVVIGGQRVFISLAPPLAGAYGFPAIHMIRLIERMDEDA